MGVIDHPARQPAPPAAISRILSRYSRDELSGFIEIAIGLLDLADGDPDLEPDGDERDGSGGEDDFCHQRAGPTPGPGCAASDPSEED
ncbi:hypothetical protein [Sphingobium estronivorans]|uniref:hypothetical protein n=1 Tax=Sphingobium estronivorans TaxID=1577690 RepID=UPI00123BABD1|nr:hypothetical protein [Sphingobium estronivorans]